MTENFPAIKEIETKNLIPYANNSRTHSEEQVAKIASSIKEFGFLNPIITDGKQGIIAGHGRVMAAQLLGIDKLPCIEASHLTEAQKKAYIIADNRLALDAGWDNDLLKIELEGLQELDFDLELTGFTEIELAGILPVDLPDGDGPPVSLADRFGIAPFSVLNAREGWWQNRKRAWLALGIQSELGRGEDLIPNGGGMNSLVEYG